MSVVLEGKRIKLVDANGKRIDKAVASEVAPLLRRVGGIPNGVATIVVDISKHNSLEKSFSATARPARKGSLPIFEDLEVHDPQYNT